MFLKRNFNQSQVKEQQHQATQRGDMLVSTFSKGRCLVEEDKQQSYIHTSGRCSQVINSLKGFILLFPSQLQNVSKSTLTSA